MPESTSPSPTNPFKKMKLAANRALIVAIIAVLLAVILGLFAANTWTRLHHLKTEARLRSELIRKNTHETVNQLQSQQQQLKTRVDQLQNKLNLIASTNQLNQQAVREAGYFVHMANLHLMISHDITTAINLLQLAIQQLDRSSTAIALHLKRFIAKDISHLEKSRTFDIAQLLAQLNQLNNSIQQLPAFPTKSLITSTPEKATTPSWRKKLGASLQGLKQLIIIRHNQQPIKPLLSPEQLQFLKQNIQLKIAAAEWAVLHQNTLVYQQSLKIIRQWLNENYSNQAAAADPLKTIDTLRAININPVLPDLTSTLSAFNTTALQTTTKEAP
jgi:uroporphyrin-III C-methyltransferase